MSDGLITAAAFSDAAEAEVACARLEAEGIRAELTDDVAGAAFGLAGAISRVELRVPPADAERALALLNASSSSLGARKRPFWRCAECDAEVDAEMEVCHGCGALAPDAPTDEAIAPGERYEDEEDREQWSTSVADRLARRAFRAAVVGFFVLPPLGHLYSVNLLFRLNDTKSELSATGRWHRTVALFLDAMVLIPVALLLGCCLLSIVTDIGRR
jgi:hypothetical protein